MIWLTVAMYSACSVYDHLKVCANGGQCEVTAGQPTCKYVHCTFYQLSLFQRLDIILIVMIRDELNQAKLYNYHHYIC